MSNWSVDFTFEADKDLAKLDKKVRNRVLDKVKWLQDNFDQITPLPFGYGWQGFFKLRVGNWRVVYDTEYAKNKITVHCVDRRDRIYKRLRKTKRLSKYLPN